MVPTFSPVTCHPLIKSYINVRTAYSAVVILELCLTLSWPHWWIKNWFGIGLLSLESLPSTHYISESAEFEFQSVPVIDIFLLHSLTGCWYTFMLQFMTLSGLFVKHDKENNKSTVYIFSYTVMCLQYPGWKNWNGCHKVKACVAIRATCKAVQYTNMIYGTLPSPFRFPSISAAIITLNSIFLVLAAWIDVHNLFTFWQILNKKHQTTE